MRFLGGCEVMDCTGPLPFVPLSVYAVEGQGKPRAQARLLTAREVALASGRDALSRKLWPLWFNL